MAINNKKIRMGMVGGGRGAFIGKVHHVAAEMDNLVELTAGAFSSNPKTSKLSGDDFKIDKSRTYPSYTEMAEIESKLDPSERIDFVSIVTPNNLHFPIAKTFLEKGIHVVCEKPLCLNLQEGKSLRTIVKKSKKVFALTHQYTGYPMVKQARDMIQNGELGVIQKVMGEYFQDWLLKPIERQGQKQAAWRTDPKQTGTLGCIGDIGSHCENIMHYMTDLEIDKLCADLTTFVKGRKVDDDGNILLRFKSGAKGTICASQISCGEENGLKIRVYGTKASLEWKQETPNYLIVKPFGKPEKIYKRGNAYMSNSASNVTRIPPGHPEGFIEAFANIYKNFAETIMKVDNGKSLDETKYDFPDITDGVREMAFFEAVIKSYKNDSTWTKISKY